mmetsp:Transcript_84224/g.140447  ORF Transcript_84224/g.140447 Transcript_84224/m.140447 type:complete len:87 (-) Transcript_84224:50-310(-)
MSAHMRAMLLRKHVMCLWHACLMQHLCEEDAQPEDGSTKLQSSNMQPMRVASCVHWSKMHPNTPRQRFERMASTTLPCNVDPQLGP